jgi:diguanylate cyclase (GGDEF)-like protein
MPPELTPNRRFPFAMWRSATWVSAPAAPSARDNLPLRDLIVRCGAGVVAGVGAAVLAGWALDIRVLKGVFPGGATMKVNTALGFVASGACLWLLHAAAPGSGALRLARGLAIFVLLLGALSLGETSLGTDLGMDQLILPDPAASPHPGRMSPATGFNFMIVGLALAVFEAPSARLAASTHWIAIPPLLLTILALAGYACGVPSLYAVIPYATFAIHTALSFLVLILALLAADSRHGIASIVFGDTAGGVVARRLLLILPLAFFVLARACLAGQLAGLYDTCFSLALMILCSITVSVAAVWWTATALARVDVARRAALADLRALNAGLESRVTERTRQLGEISETLRAANSTLEHLALHDPLTGLANRRSFDMYIEGQTAAARRDGRSLALVMFDVDAFKAFNGRYGHPAGDEALKSNAAALRSCCRRPGDMAARYGGEEFALILPDTSLADAAWIAESARRAVAGLNIVHAASATADHVSISCGVAALRGADQTAERLIEAADANLFRAKDGGRNRVVSS